MGNSIGMRAMLRVRMSANDAYYAGGLVDGARILRLFGDVATEVLVRNDGDEGLLRAYDSVEFLAPVFAGDFIEATGVLTAVGNTSRKLVFEAQKVAGNLRDRALRPSASGVCTDPVVVCRARATYVIPKQSQPRPALPAIALPPASPSNSLSQGNVYIPPPPRTIVVPPPAFPIEVILAVAFTGPASPQSVAEEARRCREAGAAVVHLHAHRPDGAPTPLGTCLAEVVQAIRASTDLVIQVSTGGGTSAALPSARDEVLACKPELATLHCGTINFGDGVFSNTRPAIRDMARRLAAAHATPQLECYEIGHIHEALALAEEGCIEPPHHFQFVLGVPGAIAGREEVIRFMASQLPEGSIWSVAAVGRQQQPMLEAAVRLGGNARVELDHGIYLAEGTAPEASASLVAQTAAYAHAIGRKVVEPARAREILGLGVGG